MTAGATIIAAVLSAVTLVTVTAFRSQPAPAAPSSPPATAAPDTTAPPDTTGTEALAVRPAVVELPPGEACPQDYLCLYRSDDHSGALLAIRANAALTALTDIPCDSCGDGTWNDQLQSWVNNSDFTYCWFSDSSFGGQGYLMTPRTTVTLLELEKHTASSINVGGGCEGL